MSEQALTLTSVPKLTPDLVRQALKEEKTKIIDAIVSELDEQIRRHLTYDRVRQALIQHERDGQGCCFAFTVTATRLLNQGDILPHLRSAMHDYLYSIVDEERYTWQLDDSRRTLGHLYLYTVVKPLKEPAKK